MRVQATNKATGEVIDVSADTADEIVQAYRMAQEYEKVAKSLKDQLKLIVPSLLDEQGRSPVIDKYQFKRIESQKSTYDMQALRDAFDNDEDLISQFLKVEKGKVDTYLKEHRDQLPEDAGYILKRGLIPDGKVVTSIRLEKVIS